MVGLTFRGWSEFLQDVFQLSFFLVLRIKIVVSGDCVLPAIDLFGLGSPIYNSGSF